MSQSFGIVEEKLREAEFFLDQLRSAKALSFESKCYFSAFVWLRAALQATMNGIDGFAEWYEQVQRKLKLDPLARFFVEIRNDAVHKGRNPLNQVPLEHLRDHLFHQLGERTHSHVIVLPNPELEGETFLADALTVSGDYFSL